MKRRVLAEDLSLTHSKKRGEWVELQFMARASQHGLVVCKPWGDSNRFDFVVEHQGKFHRVQVKSTLWKVRPVNRPTSAYVCKTHTCSVYGKKITTKHYDQTQIDFFALYIVPEELWYVIPVSAIGPKLHSVQLNPFGRNKYSKYMEAWHLLKSGELVG